jgi:hypothetical protein
MRQSLEEAVNHRFPHQVITDTTTTCITTNTTLIIINNNIIKALMALDKSWIF